MTAQHDAPLLAVNGLHKSFGGLVAAREVDFHVEQAEILGLIGPNGSGKTTVLNLISGEYRPDQGEIHLSGERIAGLPPFQISRRGLARTFQLVRVLPAMTALENVMVGAMFTGRHPPGKVRSEAEERLEQVGLAGKRDVPAGQLIYIDQKRLELGRARASRPRLLLLDEWLAGLNPAELALGVNLVQTICQSGVTMILVEHVMHAVRALCDRVVIMDAGRKVAEGKPDAVLANPEVVPAYPGDDDA
jgi:branched-chain amino acid transport system ATP-binding protein